MYALPGKEKELEDLQDDESEEEFESGEELEEDEEEWGGREFVSDDSDMEELEADDTWDLEDMGLEKVGQEGDDVSKGFTLSPAICMMPICRMRNRLRMAKTTKMSMRLSISPMVINEKHQGSALVENVKRQEVSAKPRVDTTPSRLYPLLDQHHNDLSLFCPTGHPPSARVEVEYEYERDPQRGLVKDAW